MGGNYIASCIFLESIGRPAVSALTKQQGPHEAAPQGTSTEAAANCTVWTPSLPEGQMLSRPRGCVDKWHGVRPNGAHSLIGKRNKPPRHNMLR